MVFGLALTQCDYLLKDVDDFLEVPLGKVAQKTRGVCLHQESNIFLCDLVIELVEREVLVAFGIHRLKVLYVKTRQAEDGLVSEGGDRELPR